MLREIFLLRSISPAWPGGAGARLPRLPCLATLFYRCINLRDELLLAGLFDFLIPDFIAAVRARGSYSGFLRRVARAEGTSNERLLQQIEF
jgi:hypothetical protein